MHSVPLALMSLSVLLVLHEVLHLRVHPRRGWHQDSIFDVLPRQGMLYACYPGEMSRNRLLVRAVAVCRADGAAVAGLPVVEGVQLLLGDASFTSRTGAEGDLLAVYLLLPRGVAAHGIMRNRSWRTWRRIPSG